MEPTIYKPSIYKGEGIYKLGAGGGDIPTEGNIDIAGITYRFVKIGGVFVLADDLEYNGDKWFSRDKVLTALSDSDFMPEGWRIWTEADIFYIQQVVIFQGYIANPSKALRSISGWINGNGDDNFGFNAEPFGYMDGGTNQENGLSYLFRTSNATSHYVLNQNTNITRYTGDSVTYGFGMRLRAVKDV